MHIVFASVEFVTEKMWDGGLSNYLVKASSIFADYGHKITIVVYSEGNGTIQYNENITVVRVAKDRSQIDLFLRFVHDMQLKDNLEYLWYGYQLNRRIKELDKKEKVDIVQYCHLKALGLFRIKKIPSVVRMSSFGPIDREIHKPDFELKSCRAKVALEDKLDFLALKRADSVFAPSALTALALKKVTRQGVKVLETPTMGINIMQMQCLPDNLAGKKYFLYFGILSSSKGLNLIVQSIYRILETNPQYYFVFVGKDCGVSLQEGMRVPAIRKLKEEAKEYADRVICLAPISDRELLNTIIYYAQLCILPFRYDNLSNTCVEAMELGKIVISTYKSGISQLIKDGYNGFLIEQNNPQKLVDKIKDVLELSEEEKSRVSVNATKRIQRMCPRNFYKYMMIYYQGIINSKM